MLEEELELYFFLNLGDNVDVYFISWFSERL